MGLRDRFRDRLGYIDWSNPGPHTNGNGKSAAVAAPPATAPEQKGVTINGAQFFSPDGRTFYRFGNASSEAERLTRETAFAAAWACYVALHTLASKASEPDLWIANETKDGEEWVRDHVLTSWLEQPAPSLDMGRLLYRTRLYRYITGQALWVIDVDRGGRPRRVVPFHGDEFEVLPSDDGDLRGRFRVHTSAGPRIYYADPERNQNKIVVHWIEEDPYSWDQGISKVDVALGMMNLGQQVQATAKTLLQNALMPSVIIQTHPEWKPSDQEFEFFKSLLREHAASENKGAPLAITGGGTASVVTMRLKDLIPGELLNRIEAACASVFGVPAVILQFLAGLENSPWSQMEEARRSFYEDTIDPLWVADERLLTRTVLRRVDENRSHRLRFDRSQIRALQADDTKRSAVASQMQLAWTVNELRLYTGQEPLPANDPRGDIIPGLSAPEPAEPTGEDARKGVRGPLVKSRRTPTAQETAEERDAAWYRFDGATKAQEAGWESAVHAQLQRDRKAVLAIADRLDVKAAPDPDTIRRLIAEIEAWAAAAAGDWDAVLEPLIDSTATSAVRTLASEIGIRWDLLSPGLPEFTRAHGAQLVTQITGTTRSALRETLETGLRNGESIEQLRARIQESDAAFGRSRAELIARTETTTIQNGAQHTSMSAYAADSGERVEKSWLSARDGRVRDEHRALDDESWLDIDAEFANGRKAPGEPNCRCTLLYRLPEDDE